MRNLNHFLLLIFLMTGYNSLAQEVCGNGKDDDGDGLIDLHDPDCQCHFTVTGNLLQNGSFESYKNCPTNYSYDNDYNIIDHWQYGTYTNVNEAHYYHNLNCQYDSSQVMLYMPPAFPLPDGKAFISIRQHAYKVSDIQEKDMAKSYVGQCLQSPLKMGEQYTLTFSAGRFQSNDDSIFKPYPFTVAIFGHPDCNAVPFGKPYAYSNGCPAAYPGWVMLGKTTVYSKGSWLQSRITFTAPSNINVIEIGPDCSVLPTIVDLTDSTTFLDYYAYYLDDLHLLPTKDLHFPSIQDQGTTFCSANPVLKAPASANATYQWYKDSIAIVGATDSIYPINDSNENHYYNVRITTGSTCVITEPFSLQINKLSKLSLPADTTFCTGDTLILAPALTGISYSWNGINDSLVRIMQNGVYNITATDINGCTKTFTVTAHAQDCLHCTAYVPNAFTPNGDGINDVFKAQFSCEIKEFTVDIFNRWGQKVFESNINNKGWDGTYLGKKMPAGSYVYFIRYKTAFGSYKTAKGVVTLIQ